MTFNTSFAGKTATAEELELFPMTVAKGIKSGFYAMITALRATQGSALIATNNAPLISEMMGSSVDMLNTGEEQDSPGNSETDLMIEECTLDVKLNMEMETVKKPGSLFTPNANLDIITLDAAFAGHQSQTVKPWA